MSSETDLRRFVVIGRRATASPDFSLDDLPSTSGRLDVLLRCLRAALLVSHGMRRHCVVYLVLLGGPRAPRTLRIDSELARYIRPDERSLATTVRKALATPSGDGFVDFRPGIALANGGLDTVVADLGQLSPYVLAEGSTDIRDVVIEQARPVFFLGDDLGFDDVSRSAIDGLGARPLGLGPVGVHADDAIAILHNELDRRVARVDESSENS